MAPVETEKEFTDKVEDFRKEEILPVVKPTITANDVMLMNEGQGTVKTVLHPSARFSCEERGKRYDVIVDLTTGRLVTNIDDYTTKAIPDMTGLSKEELILLSSVHKEGKLKTKTPAAQKLINKNMLVENEKGIILSDDFVFSKLVNFQTFTPVEYLPVKYDEKKNAEFGMMDARKKLSTFTKVVDDSDCWLLRYEFLKS